MLLFALTQVFWESLRRDGFLRFGFVRVNQLWCAVMLAAVTAVWLLRARPSRVAAAGSVLGLAAGIGALVALEFALTNPPSTTASSMPQWPPCWLPWARAWSQGGGARWEGGGRACVRPLQRRCVWSCLPRAARRWPKRPSPLTFVGDCTLGGEDWLINREGSFHDYARKEGYTYFFEKMRGLLFPKMI